MGGYSFKMSIEAQILTEYLPMELTIAPQLMGTATNCQMSELGKNNMTCMGNSSVETLAIICDVIISSGRQRGSLTTSQLQFAQAQ